MRFDALYTSTFIRSSILRSVMSLGTSCAIAHAARNRLTRAKANTRKVASDADERDCIPKFGELSAMVISDGKQPSLPQILQQNIYCFSSRTTQSRKR